jgi:hypothetical protein
MGKPVQNVIGNAIVGNSSDDIGRMFDVIQIEHAGFSQPKLHISQLPAGFLRYLYVAQY